MIYKEIIDNELYVYMNGSLLYKRWLNQNKGIVLDCKVFIQSFTAKDVENFKLIKTK